MLKKVQVIMLPTNNNLEFPYIAQNVFNKQLTIVNSTFAINCELQNQHLYIILDDEITSKKLLNTNDYYYIRNHYNEWYVCKFNGVSFDFINNDGNFDSNLFVCKKIIATTNASLYREESCTGYTETRSRTFYSKKPLPQPSKQFIEKYIEEYNKGNVITDVLVEYQINYEWSTTKELIDRCMPELGYQEVGNGFVENGLKLKINPNDNTITIKKVKDSYSREEVIELCRKAFLLYKSDNSGYPGLIKSTQKIENKWIEENL